MELKNLKAMCEDNDISQKNTISYFSIPQNTYSQYEVSSISFIASLSF